MAVLRIQKFSGKPYRKTLGNGLHVEVTVMTLRANAGDLPCFSSSVKSRGDMIRTCDLLVPNQTLYQAELRPDC